MRGECLEEREQRGVPQHWRDALGRGSVGVARVAAGQRECGCELRRAERELCWREQHGEQRRDERDCCGERRRGLERGEQQGASQLDCVCCERVAERQRACVPQRMRKAD